MSKILIIEDEIKLRDELAKFLINNGYEVYKIEKFENIMEQVRQIDKDIILLDIGLPNINGEYLCKEIRKESDVPIIMVTSKNTDIDELISINYGADDFIAKPYNPQILLARIERILGRVNKKENNFIEYKNMKLDISKSVVMLDNKVIELSKNEVRILYCLLINRGKIISRNQIISYLWDSEMFVDDNTLTVNINRLRNKLSELGIENMIETRRGQGYIIL